MLLDTIDWGSAELSSHADGEYRLEVEHTLFDGDSVMEILEALLRRRLEDLAGDESDVRVACLSAIVVRPPAGPTLINRIGRLSIRAMGGRLFQIEPAKLREVVDDALGVAKAHRRARSGRGSPRRSRPGMGRAVTSAGLIGRDVRNH